MNHPFHLSHDEAFLRHFRTKERITLLNDEEVAQLRKAADQGDAYAQYGYGRWLYYYMPSADSMQEAERLFYAAQESVPDARAAYAQMLCYGETENTHPPLLDIEGCKALLQQAADEGSVLAELRMARGRIFGNLYPAEPQQVSEEILDRLADNPDSDPNWYILLAFAYEQTEQVDLAIPLYEQAVDRGEADGYAYLSLLYNNRGNTALADEYMEEGLTHGSTPCFLYQVDMPEDDFQELSVEEQQQLHQAVAERLERGLQRADGSCAYFLWLHHRYGTLGFAEDHAKALAYLQRGVLLADTSCITQLLIENDNGSLTLSAYERDVLRLKAVRYDSEDKDSLLALGRADDPAFLLKYKSELEEYWQPRINQARQEANNVKEPEKTPIDPCVILIWPTGHLEVAEIDLDQVASYSEMAQTLIYADGLDPVHYSPLLNKVAQEAGLEMSLAMFVDRDGYAKDLPDNMVGTLLYGHEILGPIIIAQTDQRQECHSFKTLEDVVETYRALDKYCDGLIIIKDEEDGRYDAYV